MLFVLGLAEKLGELADIRNDAVGLELEGEDLPKRIRRSGKKRPMPDRKGTE